MICGNGVAFRFIRACIESEIDGLSLNVEEEKKKDHSTSSSSSQVELFPNRATSVPSNASMTFTGRLAIPRAYHFSDNNEKIKLTFEFGRAATTMKRTHIIDLAQLLTKQLNNATKLIARSWAQV